MDLLLPRDERAAAAALERVDVVQPALFAMQVALAALWRSWEIEPAAVVGHSMGEIAAAHVAGALSLEDATAVVCARSRLVRERGSGKGGMALVELTVAEAQSALGRHARVVAVAASNGPRSTILSGERGALEEVLDGLRRKNVWFRTINVDYASHSPQMDPLQGDLRGALRGLTPRDGAVPFFSTVTSRREDGAQLDAAYWARNLRAPVLFADVVQALAKEHKRDIFLEVSPHPVLVQSIKQNLAHVGVDGLALPSLKREGGERYALLASAGALFSRGKSVDWERLYPQGGRRVPLPTYPWQRERHWLAAPVFGSNSDYPLARPSENMPVALPRSAGFRAASEASIRAAVARSTNARAASQGAIRAAVRTEGVTPLGERLARAVTRQERLHLLEEHVRARVARVLGLRSTHPLDPDQGLFDLGLTSLLAGELSSRVGRDLGRTLSATLAFDNPTIRSIAEFLLLDDTSGPVAPPIRVAAPAQLANEPIAIVGIGCRFPGGVDGAAGFWALLRDETDAIREVPPERWDARPLFDHDRLAPDRMYTSRGGFLDAIDGFDAPFFRISPREAVKIDPQQRLLLEVAWEALEDAGIPPKGLADSETGVFVAGSPSEYLSRLRAAGLAGDDGYTLTGNLACTLSGRLSYVLGLRGPNLVVDTGCSASLVALHLACQILRNRECDLSLAAGVNLILSPDTMIELCKANALASDGHC